MTFDIIHFSVLVRLGREEEALELARRVRRAHPDDAVGLYQEAQILAAMGRREEVDTLLEEARAHPNANPATLANLIEIPAWVAAGMGRTEDAAHYAQLGLREWDRMDAATRARPSNRYNRAMLFMTAERWEEAAAILRELVAESPKSPDYLGDLGWTLARMGKADEALAIRDRIADPEMGFNPRIVHWWDAAISAALGETDRALEAIKASVAAGVAFDTWTIWYPYFLPLHDDPRYQSFIAPRT
jgi:predicted Zn-dependent protease